MRVFSKSFLLLVALLIGAELVVRVFFARNMTGRFDYGYHPTAGFAEQPNGTVNLERAGGRRFFPQSFAQQRPAGMYRIFVIGDSVARGNSVARSYAGQLGELLRARGVKAESHNLSLPGFGARRKHLVLEQALRYQPSLVILHLNNSNEFEDEREWRRREEFRGWHPKNWLMKSLVIRRLYEMKTEKVYWEWLPSSVRNQGAVSDMDSEFQASLNADTVRQWDELVRRQTGASIHLARQHGVKVLIVSQVRSVKGPEGKPQMDEGSLAELNAALRAEGVPVLSMKEALADHDWPGMFADGAHLRPEGHRLLAEAIARRLVETGIFP